MAGAIKSIKVEVGTSVTQGQTLIVLEAMKMENQITAPTAGTVKSIEVKEGDSGGAHREYAGLAEDREPFGGNDRACHGSD